MNLDLGRPEAGSPPALLHPLSLRERLPCDRCLVTHPVGTRVTSARVHLRVQTLSLLQWTLLSLDRAGNVPSRPSVPHLSRAHIAAEGIGMAAPSSVQPTFIDGHTDAAIPTPAFVTNAAVGTRVSRDTFSLWVVQK